MTTPQRQTPWRARCRETGTAGSASGLTDREQSRHRAPGRLNHLEYWIPAKELPTLNASIVGQIELVARYH